MKKKVIILFLLSRLFMRSVLAGENKGVYLSPPFYDVNIENNDKERQFDIEIGNNTLNSLTFDMSVVDFGSLDDTGGVAFLTTNTNEQKKYSLASWISLEKSEVTVEPNNKQTIKVTIINKDSLSPGGHYGAVLATLKTGVGSKGDIVGINQSLASLLYIQKINGERKNLILKNIEWKNNGLMLINEVMTRFENNGNVHVVPRGKIEIKNLWGRTEAKGIINEGSVKVLPESFRKINVKIKPVTWWRWPGKYLLEIDFRYDGKNDYMNYKTSFIYVGYEGIGLISLVVVAITFYVRKKLNKN